MSPSRGIGIGGKLPWHIKEDLAFFKEKTLGKTLLMGRKTFEGLPAPLPGRKTLILSKSVEGPDVVHSIEELPETEIWVCGGAQIYKQFFPLCEEVYLTLVKNEPPEVDAFLPEFETLFGPAEIISETPLCTFYHFKK